MLCLCMMCWTLCRDLAPTAFGHWDGVDVRIRIVGMSSAGRNARGRAEQHCPCAHSFLEFTEVPVVEDYEALCTSCRRNLDIDVRLGLGSGSWWEDV